MEEKEMTTGNQKEIRFSFDDAGMDENGTDDAKLANLLRKYDINYS